MKTLLVFISFSVSILFSQNTSFRYDFYNDLEIFTSAENISKLSSLWMADQISIGQNDSQRLFIKFGYSIYPKKINSRNWRLPDFNLGLRVSSNLLISGRFYGFHLDTDAPQIIGSGLHYGFGQHNTWMISFQKTALNGLNDFRLVSSSFNIERYFSRLFLEFYLGIGSNIYKNKAYYYSPSLPNKIDGNIKYISLKILIPYNQIKLGVASKFGGHLLLFQIFITKGFL
tara:strand:- start:317 stop:1003 length:687 start_codon:yes stop_codon:yes gene_type:complete